MSCSIQLKTTSCITNINTSIDTNTNIDDRYTYKDGYNTNTQVWVDRTSDEGKWRLPRDGQEHKHWAMMCPWQIYRQIVPCKGLPGPQTLFVLLWRSNPILSCRNLCLSQFNLNEIGGMFRNSYACNSH